MHYLSPRQIRLRLLVVTTLTVVVAAFGYMAWVQVGREETTSPTLRDVSPPVVMIAEPPALPRMTPAAPDLRPAVVMRLPDDRLWKAPPPTTAVATTMVQPTPPPLAGPSFEVRAVVLNVRRGPSLRADVIGKLPLGTVVRVLEERGTVGTGYDLRGGAGLGQRQISQAERRAVI